MTGDGILGAFCFPLRLPSSRRIPVAVCSKMSPAGSPRAKSKQQEGEKKKGRKGGKAREASPPAVAGVPGKPSRAPAAPAARARCLLQRGQRPPASSHLPGAGPARSGVAAGSPGTACEAGEGRASGKSFGKRGAGEKHRSAPGCHRAPTTSGTHAVASGTHAGENSLTGAGSAPDPQQQQPAPFPLAGF